MATNNSNSPVLPGIRRAAVVIGVDRPGNMTPLSAAASGANKFAAWAIDQGIDTVTLVDTENPVTLGAIYGAVSAYVDPSRYDQLIIYFAGHGFLLAQDTEIWMLSGAPDNANEAVNLARSRSLASKSGIPNVVFISDACRTFASNEQFHHVTGGTIFPNTGTYTDGQEVDLFYASMVGDPSFEAKLRQEGREPEHKGIFTNVLLTGLYDEERNLARWYKAPVERFVVRQRDLKTYLRLEVPKIIAEIDPGKDQRPDIQVLSDFPHFMAVVDDGPPPVQDPPRRDVISFTVGPKFRPVTLPASSEPSNDIYRASDLLKLKGSPEGLSYLSQVENAQSRMHLKTQTGFTVTGGRPLRAISDVGLCTVFEEDNAWHIRVRPNGLAEQDGGGSVLIVFEDGFVTVLAAFRGFIGVLVIDAGRVVNVSYTRSQNSFRWSDNLYNADGLEKRRAIVAALARQGMFHVDRGSAGDNAKYLMTMKSLDPTLALYAVYAYQQIGDIKGAESVFEHMSRKDMPVPFDVAMIAERIHMRVMAYADDESPYTLLPDRLHVAPFCPMLTQGWALMDLGEMPRSGLLSEMRRYLLPGLWLTLKENGMNPIINQLESEWT